MSDDARPIVDRFEAMPLADGYVVAECVGSDGEVWPWIIAPLCGSCEDSATHGSRRLVPEHERTGQLPQSVRDALVHRCGWPTKRGNGPPCRIRVDHPGEVCALHAHLVRGGR